MKKTAPPFPVHRPAGTPTPNPSGRMPQSVALEESVIGALLIEREAVTDVIDILTSQSFYREQHALIFEAIVHLFNKNQAIDPRTVVEQLRKNGALAKVGGAAYIASLVDSVASASHIEDHAHIIVEYAMRRSIIQLCNRMRQEAYDETIDVFSLLDKAEQSLFKVSEGNISSPYTEVGNLLSSAFKEIENKKDNKTGVTGVPTSFIDLDRLILGWQPSDFVILAGRPGMGKTAFMLTLLRNAAVLHKVPVAFFSLEMSAGQLASRLIALESGVDSEKIKRGSLEEYEWQQLYHKTAALAEAPIYIDDTPALSLFELRTKCRRLKVQKNIEVFFIDYLQLIVEDSNRGAGGNREQQIATISRGLKAMAKELGVTIVAASQLSRAVETRGGDKRPQLSDLRDSGTLEQDADLVICIYRADYYGITQDEEGNDTSEVAEIIVLKHRNGPTGTIKLRFIAPITKFVDLVSNDDIMASKMNEY